MNTRSSLSNPHAAIGLFALAVAAIYSVELYLSHRLARFDDARLVAIAITVDLVVVVPLAFYLLVARRRGWPPVVLVPLVVASLFAAAFVLPKDQQQPLRAAEYAIAPLELALFGWLTWKVARSVKASRNDPFADPIERIRRAAFDLTHSERAAGIVATEAASLYYGLLSWRAKPHAPEGATAFFHHERNGHGAKVFAFLLVMAAETFGFHLLLARWSPLAAWIATAGSLYTALWLCADWRATKLRPILSTEDTILVRVGLRFTLEIPRTAIVAISRQKPAFGKEAVSLAFLGSPSRWLLLDETYRARGPYGFERRVRALGIEPDDPAAFERAFGATS